MYVGYTGEHEPRALMALYGDDVLPPDNEGDGAGASIYDLVPTILAYMGLPIPSDTDGKILEDAFIIKLPNTKKRTDYLQKFRLLRKLQKLTIPHNRV